MQTPCLWTQLVARYLETFVWALGSSSHVDFCPGYDGIKTVQTERIKDLKFNVQISATDDTPSPPDYDKFTLFHSEVESYAMSQTSLASTNLQKVATLTEEQDMFMPCMVGTLESQFLKRMCQIKNARKCLDI